MNIDQIIAKMMAGSSAREELSAIEEWKKEAVDNMQALNDIKKIADFSDKLKGYTDFDEESAWSHMEAMMETSVSGDQSTVAIAEASVQDQLSSPSSTLEDAPAIDTTVKPIGMKWYSKVAAVAVVLLAATFAFSTFSKTEDAGFVVTEYAADIREEINLVDGSVITLDQSARLRARDERAVSLKGRALFDVKTDVTDPFEVKLPVGTIEVLGTQFSVIAERDLTEIYLVEGSVRYTLADRAYMLNPGECLRVINGSVEIAQMKDKNYNSWSNDKLVFDDNTMQEVVETLSRHFAESVELKDGKQFRSCNVKTSFDSYDLVEILNEFVTTHGLQYEKQGNKYIVTGSKC